MRLNHPFQNLWPDQLGLMPTKLTTSSENDGIRLDLEQRTFYRFSMLAMQINRAVTQANVQTYGRPSNGWKVVTVLGRFGSLSASQIRAHTTLEMDKITRIVDALVVKGLVTRQQDRTDRRKIIVTLSAKGRRTNSKIEGMIAGMEREFLMVLSRSERETLYGLLDRLQLRGNKVFSVNQDWKTCL